VTNRHVVAGAESLQVQAAGGVKTPVESWTVSMRDDLATLHLAEPLTQDPIVLAEPPTPGDLVAALGYPLSGPLTSGTGRVVAIDEDMHPDRPMITASMDVWPGNSGGPLIDTDGALVGLIRAIDLNEGWAVAVPVDRVRALLDEVDRELAELRRGGHGPPRWVNLSLERVWKGVRCRLERTPSRCCLPGGAGDE
jgi:S1-C subfamily serine protease